MSMTDTSTTTQVYRVYIKATPQAIWEAITSPEWTERYGYGGRAEWDPGLEPGATYRGMASEAMRATGSPDVAVDGEIVEIDPPRKLVQTWRMLMDESMICRGLHPPDLRDRRRQGRRLEAHPDPRARRQAAALAAAVRRHGGVRGRRRLELGAQRPQDAARDGHVDGPDRRAQPGLAVTPGGSAREGRPRAEDASRREPPPSPRVQVTSRGTSERLTGDRPRPTGRRRHPLRGGSARGPRRSGPTQPRSARP